jgi:hypothetical protein
MRYSALIALALLTVAVFFLIGLSIIFYDIFYEEYRRFASFGTDIAWMHYKGYPLKWGSLGLTALNLCPFEIIFLLPWVATLRLLRLSIRSLQKTFILPLTKARWFDIALGLLLVVLVSLIAHAIPMGERIFEIPVSYLGYASIPAFLFVPLWLFISVSAPRSPAS